MFFIVSSGYGFLGSIPLLLGMITVGFLSDYKFMAAVLVGSLVLAASGAVLAVAGWRLNRYGNHHSLYFLPLWVWGGAYVILGLSLAGLVGHSVSQFGWTN